MLYLQNFVSQSFKKGQKFIYTGDAIRINDAQINNIKLSIFTKRTCHYGVETWYEDSFRPREEYRILFVAENYIEFFAEYVAINA